MIQNTSTYLYLGCDKNARGFSFFFRNLLLLFALLFLDIKIINAQWQKTNFPSGKPIYSLAVQGNNLFAGTSAGVYRNTNLNGSWYPMKLGLDSAYVLSFLVNGNNIFAGTSKGVFLNTSPDSSWAPMNTGLTSTYVTALAGSGNNIFAGTAEGVFLNTDPDSSWSPMNVGLSNTYILSLVESKGTLFAGTYGGLFKSSNNGSTWDTTGLNFRVHSLITMDSILFAGSDIGIYLSTDNGNSWIFKNPGFTNPNILSFTTSGNNIFAGSSGWTDIFTGVDHGGSVFFSNNNGNTWSVENTGLPVTYIEALAISENYLIAGTLDSGVLVRPLSEMIAGIDFTIARNYIQIFPNPIKSKLFINLAKDSVKSIEIYNILGKKTCIFPIYQSPIIIDISNEPTGIYLIVIKTEKQLFWRKIMKG